MTRWLYRVINYWEDAGNWHWTDDSYEGEEAETVLNAFGSEGWELVSAVPLSWPDSSQQSGETTNIQYTFKKPAI